MTRRATGRRSRHGAGGSGPATQLTRLLMVGAVLVWLVARAFSPEAADRIAGDVAHSAGTVAMRAVTGIADVLTTWFIDTLSTPDGAAPSTPGGPAGEAVGDQPSRPAVTAGPRSGDAPAPGTSNAARERG